MAGRLRCWLPEVSLACIGIACMLLMAFHARSALTSGDRVLAAPPDALGYYSYLPAIALDGTFELAETYGALLARRPDLRTLYLGNKTPTGLTFDKYPVGSAVLWAPFFVAAHLLVKLAVGLGEPLATDGIGAPYQVAVALGSVVYGSMGFALIFRVVKRFVPSLAAWGSVATLWLAGNAIHYLTMEPIFAHAPSMFLTSLLVYVWVRGGGVAA